MEVRYGSLDEWAWEALFRTIGVETDGFHRYRKTELGICQVGWYRGNRSFRPFAFQQRNERIFCYID